jgi:hypothetical protein
VLAFIAYFTFLVGRIEFKAYRELVTKEPVTVLLLTPRTEQQPTSTERKATQQDIELGSARTSDPS